jgi:ribosomal protein L37E
MATKMHKHRPRVTHVICQRGGVPYEVERVHCSECGRLLEERPLKRAEVA